MNECERTFQGHCDSTTKTCEPYPGMMNATTGVPDAIDYISADASLSPPPSERWLRVWKCV